MHAELKALLHRRRANLEDLHKKIRLMVSLQQKRYLTQLDIEWQSSWHHILRQDFLAPLAFKISRKALKLVFEQFKMVMAAYEARDKGKRNWEQGLRMQECTGRFESQMGLPCKHLMHDRLRQNDPRLHRDDCAPFWWLDDSTVGPSSHQIIYLC